MAVPDRSLEKLPPEVDPREGAVPEIFSRHIRPDALEEAKEATGTSRADVNALKVLREHLREGVMAAYAKLEPRLRAAIRDRADLGHVSVQITVDLRAAG